MPDINKVYSWAIQTCNGSNIGYSQSYRNKQTVNGITYYDCSSFINYALLAGGFSTPSYAPNNNAFTTRNMIPELIRLGFEEVSASGEYKAGDIGWTTGHTEMCYRGGSGKGIFMGAHTSNTTLANQVSIGSSGGDATYERSFTRLFRYGKGGATGYGYSIYVISAICGNMWSESNINPGIWEGLRVGTWTELKHGYGLGQWTNTAADKQGRLYKLHQWLSDNGYSDDDGNGQLEYLIYENVWYSTQEASNWSSLQEFLNSDSTDLEKLTHGWNIGWEGIHDSSWDERVEHANTCLSYIRAHAQDSSITEWVTGNNYLSTSQILNNAVMLYRYLTAGGGGGGAYTTHKNKMPVWMMIRYNY